MRTAQATRLAWLVLSILLVGCGGKNPTAPTAPSIPTAHGSGEQAVSAAQQSIVSRHNAQFFNGRTARWQVPINVWCVSQACKAVLAFWEQGTGGAVRFNPVDFNPGEGIRILEANICCGIQGFAGVPTPTLQPPGGIRITGTVFTYPMAEQSRKLAQVDASNRFRNCDIYIDTSLQNGTELFNRVIKHELGHCIGFIDHTLEGESVMSAPAGDKIIPRVAEMLRELYRLPIGTEVH